MSCRSCGAKLPAKAEFCTSCGARVAEPAPEKTAPGEPAPEAFVDARPGQGVSAQTHTEPSSGPSPEALGEAPSAEAEEKPRTLPKGTVIDHKYSIVRVLGEGGMGVVYLAEDIHTGIEVVLKAMRPELAHRKDVRERTLAEGRTLARIDHPNVVHLNAVVTDETGLWLVMQYIEGESLDRTIKRYKDQGQTIAFTVGIDIFRQVLMGVAAAHHEGVIHRDLKPANVLVRRKDGVAKVTDFGIAKPVEQARAGQGNTKGVIGSLWYMSPEQVQGKRELDLKVDVYSLGILLFELVTGHVPFNATSSYEIMRMHVDVPIPKASAERKDAPAWIDDVIGRACAKKREERFSSCEEFLAAIDANMAGGRALTKVSIPAPPEPKPMVATPVESSVTTTVPGSAPAEAAKRSRAWVYALVAAVVLAGGGVAAFFALQEPEPVKKPKKALTSEPVTSASSEAGGPVSAEPNVTAAPSAAPKANPLDALVGRWKSEAGTDFEAVRVGDTVEFRVVDPKQFGGADYQAGEARFTLRVAAGDGAFVVEEHMRPVATIPFDPKSRASCQDIWTEVDERPLGATLNEGVLRVDFAKVKFSDQNFKVENDNIIACQKLRGSARGRGRTELKRAAD